MDGSIETLVRAIRDYQIRVDGLERLVEYWRAEAEKLRNETKGGGNEQ